MTTARIFLCTSTPAIQYAIRCSWRERRTCCDCLIQGHGLPDVTDAPLFAHARTFRTIQLNGLNSSTGSIDLTARAAAIVAREPMFFMRFRELTSARGNALLQLSKPVDHDLDLRR